MFCFFFTMGDFFFGEWLLQPQKIWKLCIKVPYNWTLIRRFSFPFHFVSCDNEKPCVSTLHQSSICHGKSSKLWHQSLLISSRKRWTVGSSAGHTVAERKCQSLRRRPRPNNALRRIGWRQFGEFTPPVAGHAGPLAKGHPAIRYAERTVEPHVCREGPLGCRGTNRWL